MKKNIVRKQSIIFMLALAAASMLAGCQKTDETRRENSNPSTSAGTTMSAGRDNSTGNAGTKAEEAGEELTGASALEVRFGDDGAPIMRMETMQPQTQSPDMWEPPTGDCQSTSTTIMRIGK